MSKTWDKAILAHRDRLEWCLHFREVLLSLIESGAPPPDDVGAAHADWATIHGVLRLSMTLKGGIALVGAKTAPDLPENRLATAENLAEHATIWGKYIRLVYVGHARDPDTGEFTAAAKSEQQEVYEVHRDSERTAEQMVENRDKPYWQPSGVKR